MTVFTHRYLSRALTREEAMDLTRALTWWAIELPLPAKPLSGKESWGGDPLIQREHKRTKARR